MENTTVKRNTIQIHAGDFKDAAQLLDFISKSIGSPDNDCKDLEVLNYCIQAIEEPMAIEAICKDHHSAWFKEICHCIKHAAKDNSNLQFSCWKISSSENNEGN